MFSLANQYDLKREEAINTIQDITSGQSDFAVGSQKSF